MSDFVIFEKHRCECPITAKDFDYSPARCTYCRGKGYILHETDLLDVLAKLRFSIAGEVVAEFKDYVPNRLIELRIEDSE